MIGNTKAAAVVSPSPAKVSKEPDFLGPDELPMLPEYLVEQNPTDADKYHMQLKEWWESVHENLGRMYDMVVSYQVPEAKEKGEVELKATKVLLSEESEQQAFELVQTLDTDLQQVIEVIAQNINEHIVDLDNPHEVEATDLELSEPAFDFDPNTKTLTITSSTDTGNP